MKPSRVVLIVIGSLMALLGFVMFVGGGALGWALTTQRDDSGYFTSSTERYATPTYALTSERIDLTHMGSRDWWARRNLASVRLRVDSVREGSIFVGIGPDREVETYLAGVSHEEISNVDFNPFHATYRSENATGTSAPGAPTSQKFWAVSAAGPATQTIDWKVLPGAWAIVVMNADGSRPVAADINFGAKISALTALAVGLGIGGGTVLAVGTALIIGGATGSGRKKKDQTAAVPTGGVAPAAGIATSAAGIAASTAGGTAAAATLVDLTAHERAGGAGHGRSTPVTLEAEVDPQLSRWLWIVKWLLAIPHFLVLALLWVAFSVMTVVAFFAILFSGTYPQSIFDFNVGVLRWTWRVGFYCTSAFGTDRYPPFSLAEEPDYPARLDVAYPARLSRGLIFVKWFLAIPHLVIIGILGASWTFRNNNSGWRFALDGGLLGLLVIIAGLILLFTGKYPKGLFDVIMGCNRWTYRVIAYVALMTDQYPPFHFDQGPTEPTEPTPPQPPPVTQGPTRTATPATDTPVLIDH
jgi:Domain of unknown function (DUF4389)